MISRCMQVQDDGQLHRRSSLFHRAMRKFLRSTVVPVQRLPHREVALDTSTCRCGSWDGRQLGPLVPIQSFGHLWRGHTWAGDVA